MLADRKEDHEFSYEEERFSSRIQKKVEEERAEDTPQVQNVLNRPLRQHAKIFIFMMVVMSMAVVVRNGIIATHGYELVDMQQKAQKLEQENERLRIEIAHLKSPQRIKAIATEQLGMSLPTQVYFAHEK